MNLSDWLTDLGDPGVLRMENTLWLLLLEAVRRSAGSRDSTTNGWRLALKAEMNSVRASDRGRSAGERMLSAKLISGSKGLIMIPWPRYSSASISLTTEIPTPSAAMMQAGAN